MKNIAPAVFLTASLLLVGGGCTSRDGAKGDAPSNEVLTIDGDKALGAASDDAVRPLVPATTDETWKTYTNDALGFQFLWPSKGLYAPRWEVTFAQEGSETIKDGCRAMESATTKKVSVDGVVFCHTSVRADGSATDHYTTALGATHAIISFTKTPPKGAETTFSWDEYGAQLDSIIGTFAKR